MKPVSLEFEAFGPYLTRQRIDFSKLYENGLFLICGNTGSGKTTILDAMTYALYGKSCGMDDSKKSGARGSLEHMRCNLASDDAKTFVRYVFEVEDMTYCFERAIVKKRKHFHTEFHLTRAYRQAEFEAWIPNVTETVMNRQAEDILHLSYEQFCQVIILPQGQFEEFLTSNSSDKQAILTRIFQTEKWDRLQLLLKEKLKSSEETCAKIEELRKNILDENACQTEAEIKLLLLNKKKTYDNILKTLEALSHEKGKLEEKRKIIDAYQKKEKAEAALCELANISGEIGVKKNKLNMLEGAERLKPYMEHVTEGETQLNQRRLELADSEVILSQMKLSAAGVQERFEAFVADEPKRKNDKQQLETYKAKIPLYTEYEHFKADRKKADMECQKAKKNCVQADKEAEAAKALCMQADQDLTYAETEYDRIMELYLSEVYCRTAKKLPDGFACPVCGSTNHPKKKQIAAGMSQENIDEDTLKAARISREEKRSAWEACDNTFRQAQTRQTEAKNHLTAWTATFAEAASNVSKAEAQLLHGVKDKAALDKAILCLESKVKQAEQLWQTLEKERIRAEADVAQAKESYHNKQNELARAKENLKTQAAFYQAELQKYEMSEETAKHYIAMLDETNLSAWKQEIADYETKKSLEENARTNALEEIGTSKKTDVKRYEEEKIKNETAFQKLQEEKGRIDEQIKRLTSDNTRLEAVSGEYEAAYNNMELYKMLNDYMYPRSGVALSAYILGIMLSSVIVEANVLLENVHGGRYRLVRSDKKAGGSTKVGLELEILDANATDANHMQRSVKSLSGGEKFLVALALAIGLSTVAQNRGFKLDAMFIDEGFGSLDTDSIKDAMEVLGCVQSSNGLVGIISHVDLLKSSIPVQMHVTTSPAGSTLAINC